MVFRFSFRWRVFRPFPSLHWTVPCGFVALWLWLYLQSACKSGPLYEETTVLTATLVSAMWVAVSSTADLSGWRKLRRTAVAIFQDLISLFMVVAALVIPLSLFLPAYQCYGDRGKVSELVLAASSYRSVVAERAQARQSLAGVGGGLLVKTEGRVHGGAISANGIITLFSEEPRALIVLRPYFENSEVKWACEGFPLKAMPAQCRQLPYQTP